MNFFEKLNDKLCYKKYRIVKEKGKYYIQEQGFFGGWSNFMFDFYVYRDADMWDHNGWEYDHQIYFSYETFEHAKDDLAFYLTYKNETNVKVGYSLDSRYLCRYEPILLKSNITTEVTSTMKIYPCTLSHRNSDIINLDEYEYDSVSDDEKYYEIYRYENFGTVFV